MRDKGQQVRDWLAKVASDLKIARTESATRIISQRKKRCAKLGNTLSRLSLL